MSSHHIVREKQEPALVALGLESFPEEMLGQLLEWSPTVIATPLVAELINSFGIKIDIIIADAIEETLQSDVKLVALGDDSPLEAALKYLIANTYTAVNIVTDELHLSLLLYYADKINLVIFSKGQKVYPVVPGFSKWKPEGEYIRILSYGQGLQLSGLEEKEEGVFMTTADGFITLQFNAPFVFIAEDI
jgi:thiamine pyrophosphokinase